MLELYKDSYIKFIKGEEKLNAYEFEFPHKKTGELYGEITYNDDKNYKE